MDRQQNACVVVYLITPGIRENSHEGVTQRRIARQLAAIKGVRFGGDYEIGAPGGAHGESLYFVPGDTLDLQDARRLGINGELDLFGGVVPYAFVSTKTITHPLIASDAHAPGGWTPAFASQVSHVVLRGYSAFSPGDARLAGKCLLEEGPVRIKLASGSGGLGQAVAYDSAELENALQEFEPDDIAQGVVLEQNMHELATLSIGQARVDDILITYHGVQRLTPDNHGALVYGGSDLVVVRGDFEALMKLPLSAHERIALDQARAYHAAAGRAYTGLFASRCNYDVAQGLDSAGDWRSGVLEQSWRVGGASGAELAAIQAFMRDPDLCVVRASTTEAYGDSVVVPRDATLYYSDIDERVGRLTKYARIEGYDDT
jgi:hypothetical protein